VPIVRRSAIRPTVIVVSARKRAAKATFTESALETCGLSEIEGDDFQQKLPLLNSEIVPRHRFLTPFPHR
jgi:hypothetical protein